MATTNTWRGWNPFTSLKIRNMFVSQFVEALFTKQDVKLRFNINVNGEIRQHKKFNKQIIIWLQSSQVCFNGNDQFRTFSVQITAKFLRRSRICRKDIM